MKLYLNNKKIIIFPFLLKSLGRGEQGKVYKYNGYALKIIHWHESELTIRDCAHLKRIKTKRILLPKCGLINDKKVLSAYITELIKKHDTKQLNILSKKRFLDEIYSLKKELSILSDKRVIVRDLSRANFMYDGMFRFVDPGRYFIDYEKNYNIEDIRRRNNKVLKNFILGEMIVSRKYPNYHLEREKNSLLKTLEDRYERLGCTFIGEYIDATMKKTETIGQYIKRSIR